MLRMPHLQADRTTWLRVGVYAALGTALVWVSIVSVGVPGTALIAGGWLLAAGLSRRVPGMDGPVSWAAAVVLVVGIVSFESLLLAGVSGHEHGWRAHLGMLILTGLLCLLLLV